MKTLFTILFVGAILLSCSQNEQPQSTEQADYAETEQDLILNPDKDSAMTDSIPTAMPPQQQPVLDNE